MSANIRDFLEYFRSHESELVETLIDDAKATVGGYYATAPREQVRASAEQLVAGWMEALQAEDPKRLLDTARAMVRRRAAQNVAATDLLGALNCVRRGIWGLLRQYHAAGRMQGLALVETLDGWMHAELQEVLSGYTEILHETQAQLASRERLLADQTKLIQELSTPIIPLLNGVLVLPLVGMLDTHRAAQVMEATLSEIQENRAEVLILDVTGVPTIDTNVAHHLIQLARAVEMLGAKVILVGLRPEIARTVVQMGVDLGTITTLANLQAGIAHALAQRGLRIGHDVGSPDGRRAAPSPRR